MYTQYRLEDLEMQQEESLKKTLNGFYEFIYLFQLSLYRVAPSV